MRVWPQGAIGYVKRARVSLKKIAKSGMFENLMTFCVLLNTITLALDRYGMPKAEQVILGDMNTVFTWIFIVEMGSKLLAVGPGKYL